MKLDFLEMQSDPEMTKAKGQQVFVLAEDQGFILKYLGKSNRSKEKK